MDVNLLSDELKTVMNDLVKAEFEKQLSEKDSLIAQLQDEVAYLNQQIEWFRKKCFGSKSEKTLYIDPAQKSLFSEKPEDNNLLDAATKHAIEEKTVHVLTYDRKAKRSRKEIYDNLPIKEEIIDLPESERFDANGRPLVRVGKHSCEQRFTPNRQSTGVLTTIPFSIRQPILNLEHANL